MIEFKNAIPIQVPIDNFYDDEDDLLRMIEFYKPDVRILGDDYIGKYATGQEYSDQIVYIDRNHGWSTTKYKTLLVKSINGESK